MGIIKVRTEINEIKTEKQPRKLLKPKIESEINKIDNF